MAEPPPAVILFDLGGVLVRWDGAGLLAAVSDGAVDREASARFWGRSPWLRRFERGECSAAELGAGVVRELCLPIGPEAFLEAFFAWDCSPFPGTLELLDALRPRFQLACLSNNNAVHWGRIRDEHGLGRRFHRCYLSHEIGRVKPDAAAFEHVLADLGRRPQEVAFLDDSPACVDAARELGLRARQVRGLEQVHAALAALGIEA